MTPAVLVLPFLLARASATLLVTATEAGDALSVEGWKTGGAWTLRVSDPSGGDLASVSWREPAVTTLSWTAPSDGPFRVECSPADDSGASCELAVIRGRSSGSDPSRRARLETELRQGYELMRAWSPASMQRAQQTFRKAHDESRALDWVDIQVDSLIGQAS